MHWTEPEALLATWRTLLENRNSFGARMPATGVDGMTCGGCEQAINEALEKQEGIFRSEASHLKGHVKVHYDAQKVKPAVMVNTVNALGYRANSSKPDPDIKPVEQKDAKDLKGHEMVGKKKLSSPGKAPAPQQNP